jgi:hypothetical protein
MTGYELSCFDFDSLPDEAEQQREWERSDAHSGGLEKDCVEVDADPALSSNRVIHREARLQESVLANARTAR